MTGSLAWERHKHTLMEINISLRQDSAEHLYEQIYEYFKEEIHGGRLLAGEKLPSSRSLAQSLRVARSTVELAYSQLQEEGYIATRRGSGAYVCAAENLHILSEPGPTPDPEKQAGTPDDGTKSALHNGSRMSRENRTGSASDVQIDFSPRKIDMSNFPYATWRRILRGILAGGREDVFERGDPQGEEELRATIARYLHFSRGIKCTPEQIVIGAGNDYLLMLLDLILGSGRTVGMENPSYLRAYNIFKAMDYEVRPVAMDEAGMSVEDLRAAGCDLAYVMPSHQYPLGIVMPYSRRTQLLKWASEELREDAEDIRDTNLGETAEKPRYIIEDDYDSEFRYRGRPLPSLSSLDAAGRVIYIGTFSKTIAPAIRISFLCLPKTLLADYHRNCGFLSSTVSRIDQCVLEEFIDGGYFERYLNKMRNIYRGKHDLLLRELSDMKEDFEVLGDGAGLHLILADKKGRTEKELEEKAREYGVKVYPMTGNYLPGLPVAGGKAGGGEQKRSAILLGYAALSEENIKEGVRRLKAAYR